MMRPHFLVSIAAVALSACGRAPPVDHITALLDGRVAGAAAACLARGTTDEVHVGASGIIYEAKDNVTFWYNRPTAGAANLRDGVILSVGLEVPQLCEGDRVETIDAAAQQHYAAITLGPFIPYRRP